MFLISMVISPGMFHASVAYFPSSFAMYATMLGLAAFMDWRGGLKTAQGIMWFGIAGIVGWPFASALAIPFVLEETALALISKLGFETAVWRVLDGVTRCLIVLVCAPALRLRLSSVSPNCYPGIRGVRRSLFLPQCRGGTFQSREIQHLWWLWQRPQYFWHRTMAFLYPKSIAQFQCLFRPCSSGSTNHPPTIFLQ